MSTPYYIIRNYHASDFDSLFQLKVEAARLTPGKGYVSPQVIRESVERPNYSPEQELFLAEMSETVVGYMDVTAETRIGRAVLDCFIQPERRRQGLARRLLNHAERRAKEVGAVVAHVNILENNTPAQKVLARLSFRSIRRFHELRLALNEATIRQGFTSFPIRHLQPGEEDKLTHIQNRSFAGSWGYNPNTIEEISYKINSSTRSPEDVVLAYDRDKVIGYCWTEITCAGEAAIGEIKGRISMMGVDPDYRGRGVGKRVLVAGLAYLKSKGLQVAELTVDSENGVACALYHSIGFEICATSLWYEKVLD